MPANWTAEQVTIFVRILRDVVLTNGATENGLKKQHWQQVVEEFNRATGADYTREQLQSKLQTLKRKYGVFAALVANSGFGWNEAHQLPTAPEEVWTNYVRAHPAAGEFRYHTLPNYDELRDIFEGNVATGVHANGTAAPAPAPAAIAAPAPAARAATLPQNEAEDEDSDSERSSASSRAASRPARRVAQAAAANTPAGAAPAPPRAADGNGVARGPLLGSSRDPPLPPRAPRKRSSDTLAEAVMEMSRAIRTPEAAAAPMSNVTEEAQRTFQRDFPLLLGIYRVRFVRFLWEGNNAQMYMLMTEDDRRALVQEITGAVPGQDF